MARNTKGDLERGPEMKRSTLLLAAGVGLMAVVVAAPVRADDDDNQGGGWRHYRHHGWGWGAPVVVVPPPVSYAPLPYYGPAVVYGRPLLAADPYYPGFYPYVPGAISVMGAG